MKTHRGSRTGPYFDHVNGQWRSYGNLAPTKELVS